MLDSGNLDMSFSGLKTAVVTVARAQAAAGGVAELPEALRAAIAAEFQQAVVDVLCAKAMGALEVTGHRTLVVAGGVGANRALRARLQEAAAARGARVHFPDLALCTDNAAMIALAGAWRLEAGEGAAAGAFTVRPRWPLVALAAAKGQGAQAA
jgi:N6-L-threonylcarbamoyladenine synthase